MENTKIDVNRCLKILSMVYPIRIGSILKKYTTEHSGYYKYYKLAVIKEHLYLCNSDEYGNIVKKELVNAIDISQQIKGKSMKQIKQYFSSYKPIITRLEFKKSEENNSNIQVLYKKNLVAHYDLRTADSIENNELKEVLFKKAAIDNRKQKCYLYTFECYSENGIDNEVIKYIFDANNINTILIECCKRDVEYWQDKGASITKEYMSGDNSVYGVILDKGMFFKNLILRSKLRLNVKDKTDITEIERKIDADLRKIIKLKGKYKLYPVVIHHGTMNEDWGIVIEAGGIDEFGKQSQYGMNLRFITNYRYTPDAEIYSDMFRFAHILNPYVIINYLNSIFVDGKYSVLKID